MLSKISRLEDETAIPKASLLRVLEGVAVATKAPDKQVQMLNDLIRGFKTNQIDENMHESCRRTAVDPENQSLSFSQWCLVIAGKPQIFAEGVRQLTQVTLAVALLRERSRRELPVDTTRINEIWSLIHDAIVSASATVLKFTVSRSAQGFLAVPLCSLLENGCIDELWRLHTWLPDGQRGISEEVCIHAHQPFGQSWTLLGSGTDCTFEVDEPEDLSLTTHAAYECCYMSESGHQSAGASGYQTFQLTSTIRNTGRFLRVKPLNQLSHSRDMTYSVPGGAYHRSLVAGNKLHATIFVFDSQRGYDDNAAVLGPKDGDEWVQPRDPADLTAVVLAQIVDAARKWEQKHETASKGKDEHPTILAYYNLFRGLGLLQSGRRDDAMHCLRPIGGSTPEQAFLQEPSQEHQSYIQKLRELGITA
ncbi:hypothetical protein yc1106_00568 [Curvularia clavata]|uniref:Uncharacterized protein n=1 Tax=Curvularia clavata TaxID=95742 RepID=A0A9Q8Z1U4_CURCL|nr:hypothetical protein yc1106_00568 [Curvularia clavata]